MRLPKHLTTVTTFSKLLALLMFITLPVIGFFIGMLYENIASSQPTAQTTTPRPSLMLTPTNIPDDNSNNASLFFTLKYPDSWKKTSSQCSKSSSTSLSGLGITKVFEHGTAAITICVFEGKLDDDHQISYINKSAAYDNSLIRDEIVSKPVTEIANGNPVHKAEEEFDATDNGSILPTYIRNVLILHGKYVYVIQESFGLTTKSGDFTSAKNKLVPEMNNIIGTLKFPETK